MLVKNGNPLLLYHGTCATFDAFRPLSHFGTRRAAELILKYGHGKIKHNQLTLTPKNNIDFFGKQPTGNPRLIPVHLKISHPLPLPDMLHTLSGYAHAVFCTALARQLGISSFSEATYQLAKEKNISSTEAFTSLCRQADFMPDYRFIFNDPLTCPTEQVKRELFLGNLYRLTPFEQENREHLIVQRLIRYWERQGYDGICYFNDTEDIGSRSYIAFRPEQVIRLDKPVPCRFSYRSAACEAELDKIWQNTVEISDAPPLDEDESSRVLLFEMGVDTSLTNPITDEKTYWTWFALEKVMPRIAKITKQSQFGYHGLEHTEQVVLFGIAYALAENVRPLPVILACALHDCARTHDKYDEKHGPACEPIARAFLKRHRFDLTDVEIEKIIYAVKYHTTGCRAPSDIAACLWDADRTRLSWERGFKPHFFSTASGRRVGAYTPAEQKSYIAKQTAFLDAHPEWNTLLNSAGRQASRQAKIKAICVALNNGAHNKER